MPKGLDAPSLNWNVNDQIKQSKEINKKQKLELDNYNNRTKAFDSISTDLDTLEGMGHDVSKLRDKLNSKVQDVGFTDNLGMVGRKIGDDYAKSVSKLFGGELNKTYQQKLDEAKYNRELTKNPISTIATDVALDPLTYTPLNFASKGSKAIRMAKDFGKGAGVVGATETARNYGNDNWKPEHTAIAMGIGGGINSLLGRYINRAYKGDVPTNDITSGIKQEPKLPDEEIAKRMRDNNSPQQEPIKQIEYKNTINVEPTPKQRNDMMIDALKKDSIIEADGRKVNRFQDILDLTGANKILNKKAEQKAEQNLTNKMVDDTQETKVFNGDTELTPLEELEGIIRQNDTVSNATMNSNENGLRNAITRYRNNEATPRDLEVINNAQNYLKDTMGSESPIVASNAGHNLAGGFAGGAESEFNQRDYNNDGKHDYKDNIYGALVGVLGINGAKKIFPKAFKDEVQGNKIGMFVGAKDDELGAFSDIASKKTMREIDDSKATYKNIPMQEFRYDGEIYNQNYANLGDILEHPELFAKYPELKDVQVSLNDKFGNGGSFNPAINSIALDKGNVSKLENMDTTQIRDMIKKYHANPLDKDYARLNKELENPNLDYKDAEKILDELDNTLTQKTIDKLNEKLGVATSNANKNGDVKLNNSGKSTILHEIQHSIQNKEGWARGGSPDEFKDGVSDEFIKQYSRQYSKLEKDVNDLSQKIFDARFNEIPDSELSKLKSDYEIAKDKLSKLQDSKIEEQSRTKFNKYESLWGEQQARATQQRMNMTPEQRASEDWTKTLERVEGKYNEPIIKYDDGVSMSVSKEAEKIKRDENFKKWFSGSKVVDEKGEPLVVYHGTTHNFSMFDKNKVGQTDAGWFGKGFYFTSKADSAGEYAGEYGGKYVGEKKPLLDKNGNETGFSEWVGNPTWIGEYEDGANIMPVFLKMDNPKIIKETPTENYIPPYFDEKKLQQDGYDGVILKLFDDEDGSLIKDEYVVFEPTQIKSIHNKGTFDGNNPNILMSSPTISGGIVGGVVGGTNDIDGDGKITAKDIALGALGGVIGTKAVLKAHEVAPLQRATNAMKRIANSEFIGDFAIGHKIYQKESYMNLREKMLTGKNQKLEDYAVLHEQLKLLGEDTRKAMYKYLSGENVQLNGSIKALADDYKKTIETKGQELVNMGVLEKEQYEKFKGRYLHRRYTKDISEKMQGIFSKGKTIGGVHTRGREWTGTKTEFDKYVNEGQIGSFFEGKITATKMKNGQYKFNQDWTAEQRARWGEIQDVAYSLPETLQKMDEMYEHAKFLKGIVDDSKYVSDEAIDGYVQLQGKRFGALQNKYVPKDIANDITEFNDVMFGLQDGTYLSKEVKDAWRTFGAYWKKTHTVYNPVAHMNNLQSNITMQFMEGINPHKAYANAVKAYGAIGKLNKFRELTAKKLVGLSDDEATALKALEGDDDLQLYVQAQKSGLFGRSQLNDILNKYVSPSTNKGQGVLGKIDDKLSAVYQGEDNIMRFSLLKSLVDKGETFESAIKRVNNTIPDYTKPMSPLARFARNSLTVPFISWTYYSTPILLRQMKERPERLLAVFGALYGMNRVSGIDPFNKDDIPQQNFSMKRIPIPIISNGKEKHTIKVDRWIPHSELFSPVDFVNNIVNGGFWKLPYEITGNKNLYYGGKISYNTGVQKAYDISKYAVQSLTPDVLDKTWNLAESALVSEKKRTKHPVVKPRNSLEETLGFLGINTLTYDKNRQAIKSRQEDLKEKLKRD